MHKQLDIESDLAAMASKFVKSNWASLRVDAQLIIIDIKQLAIGLNGDIPIMSAGIDDYATACIIERYNYYDYAAACIIE